MTTRATRGLVAGTVIAALATLTACSDSATGSGGDSSGDGATTTLTVYTGQHEETIQALADGFTAETGIEVDIRAGEDAEMTNQVIEEGDSSPADVYLSEEPGPIGQLDAQGLLAPVPDSTTSKVVDNLAPDSGNWVPYAARSRVIFYNPSLIGEDELPDSILDLADPAWKGRFAYAPSGAFTSTVSYLISDIGKDRTLAWLKAIQSNGINEQSNGKVRDTVEAGQHPFGLSNHYYWAILAAQKGGPDKLASKVHYFDHPDAGSLLLASGAGILKSGDHQDAARQFLAWLVSTDGGQQVIADDDHAQFPVVAGVTSTAGLPPITDLHPPADDQSVFANLDEAKDLIVQSGIV